MVALDVDDKFAELGTTYKNDPDGFDTNAKAYMKGLIGSVPEEIKLDMQNYTGQYYRQGLNAAVKAKLDETTDEVKAQFITTVDSVQKSILTALSNGDSEKAAFIEEEHKKNLPGYVAAGVTTEADIAKDNIKFEDRKLKAYIYGDVNRSYINNPDLSIDERKEEGKKYLASFDNTNIPELDPKGKKAVRAELQTMFENAYARDKLEIVEARTASFTENLNNVINLDNTVMNNPDLTTQEKAVAVNQAEFKGLIDEKDRATRIRLINSVENLNNSKTPIMEARIVELAYNVLELALKT
jgi:hypothetical protein